MKALFWTTDGIDIWRVTERRVFEFKNLDTDEVVRCEDATGVIDAKFVPVKMPKIGPRPAGHITDAGEKAGPAAETKTAETKEVKAARKKSKYKGVSPAHTAGKFRVKYWDGVTNIGLGTFDSELLAAAAYQDHIGNTKEAVRLREEYAEGDRMPEGPRTGPPETQEPPERYKGVYPVKNAKGVIRYHAQITHNKKQKHFGTHDTIRQAAAAIEEFRKKAAEKEKQPGEFPSEQ